MGAMVDANRAEGPTWRILGMDIGRVLRLVANWSRDDAVRDAEEKSVFCREAMVVPPPPGGKGQGASGKPRDKARCIRRSGGINVGPIGFFFLFSEV